MASLDDIEIEMAEVEATPQVVALELAEDEPTESHEHAPASDSAPVAQDQQTESHDHESVSAQAPQTEPTLDASESENPDTVQPKLPTLRSYSVPAASERHRFPPKSPSKRYEVPLDDIIAFVDEVDICLDIPPKLKQIDYPKVADTHEEDVAKVIRKKFSKLGIDGGPTDVFSFLSSDELQTSFMSWQARIEEAVMDETDEFWERVSRKTNELRIGRMEAIFEVYTDILIDKAGGSVDQALLWVLRQDFKEFCAEVFVIRLLQREARVTTAGPDRNTPLHLAAIKGFTNVGIKLVESGAFVAAENKEGYNALALAVLNDHCDFSVLMVKNMDEARVREMFQGQGTKVAKLSLHSLLLKQDTMNDLVLAVLDTMMERLEDQHDTFVVHYSVLDGDREGRPPNDPHFVKAHKSCLHKIAKSNNKVLPRVLHIPHLLRIILALLWESVGH